MEIIALICYRFDKNNPGRAMIFCVRDLQKNTTIKRGYLFGVASFQSINLSKIYCLTNLLKAVSQPFLQTTFII